MATLKELRQQRIQNMQALMKKGINPFPSKSLKDLSNNEVIQSFEKYENKELTLAGRLMSWREHGELAFGHIEDQSGKIQLYIHMEELALTASEYGVIGRDDLRYIDVGDFLEVKGVITKTKRGEISIRPSQIRLLTKSIRPLPEKWSGIQDKEQRYRRRYLDLIMDKDVRDMFIRKTKFWDANREFMNARGFIEVQTPILEHVPGGADANPFVTHMNALDQNFYLRISPELYLKRLIGGGYEKVYTIGPNFRNEGLSDEHLPEFYNIEWYWAYADYKDNMGMIEEMFKFIAEKVYGRTKFVKNEHEFDLGASWQNIDYIEIIKERFGVDIFTETEERMKSILDREGVVLGGEINRNRLIDNLWKVIRKGISGPAFLLNEPKFMSPLAKSKVDDPRLTERFHLIIAGSELGNGYTELNDPIDQFERFSEQQNAKDSGDKEAQMMDIDFVEMLEYGMPPTSGYAHGERLFWFLENITAREGTFFPQLKYKLEQTTKQIYGISDSKLDDNYDEAIDIHILSNTPVSDLVKIDTKVKEIVGELKLGYIEFEVKNNSNIELSELHGSVLSRIEKKYQNMSDIKNSDYISSFREVYKRFGVDPNKKLNSSEALIRKIVSGKGLFSINPIVDIYNITSAEFELPMAAYDLDKVDGKISLRISNEEDTITKIGEKDATPVKSGELVYSDEKEVICLDYNYRDSDKTKITKDTKRFLVIIDATEIIEDNYIDRAMAVVSSRMVRLLGAKILSKGSR